MKKLTCLIMLMLVIFASACERNSNKIQSNAGEAIEQKTAPDITVTALDGTALKLSSLKGKVVLLNFWATWCPPCREEIPSMMKLNSAMSGKPFQMLAVSIDEGGKPSLEEFFKSTGFTLPTYMDQANAAGKIYGITGVPESFLIDKKGIIVKKIIGPVEWDSPEVKAFIEELLK